MAFKQFVLDERTTVTIYKRRANRSLRLTVTPNGEIRVTIPIWAPYKTGLDFAKTRRQWIADQTPSARYLTSGQPIGKAHRLRFISDAKLLKPATRIRLNEVTVSHPSALAATHPTVQKAAQQASIRALRQQAEKLLPARVNQLAAEHGFTYHSLNIKKLKSRWGSCDQHHNLVFNLFLMQLPWECIDYVIIHELVHTEVLQHGPKFWQTMEQHLPNVQQSRRLMRTYQPVLQS